MSLLTTSATAALATSAAANDFQSEEDLNDCDPIEECSHLHEGSKPKGKRKRKSLKALDANLGEELESHEFVAIAVTAPRLPHRDRSQKLVRLHKPSLAGPRIDTLLSSEPGLTLFRRANSETAHPTTQGLSMRGVGANGAGRVLVTLDGIPQNDPFGGWVYWSALPAANVYNVNIRKGGSPGTYGVQALAGTVEISTGTTDGGHISFGARETMAADLKLRHGTDFGELTFSAGFSDTAGAYLFGEGDRGSVDVPAASTTKRAEIGLDNPVGRETHVLAKLAYFSESRTNGLSLAVNETEAIDASLRIVHDKLNDSGAEWEIALYYRDRQFDNVFASARDDRTSERAVLDQYDVPAWGAGILARVQFQGFELGIDGRRMSGETNERFRNLGAGFTRQRRAGGDQWTLGLYGEYSHEVDWGDVSATLRYDRWRTYGGVRDEYNIENGFPGFASPDRSDDIPNRSGGEWTGRLGAVVPVTGAIDMRIAAYKTWRLPTLNEYYRPFRVVNDITEANPNLTPETLYGVEVGFDYEPMNTMKLSATYYRNWLKDGVGNVTIGFGPGFFALGGFVPDGGVLRQRANVDESITDGIELDARLDLQPGWTLSADYLYARARITAFEAMPDLVGKRLVQTPRHSFTLSAKADLSDDWTANIEGRFASGQYDDDLNSRRLGGIFTINAGGQYHLMPDISLTAAVENLFDAKVVSAITADGLETIAQRRFWRVGLEVRF
ncbi:MAG: TonB-dependent receptor [Alphaproteobacteria bacterium]|nr:TonB-dependent receptor [Alphaproteobacteria bacterium]